MKLPSVLNPRVILVIVSVAAGSLAMVIVRNMMTEERRSLERERQQLHTDYQAPIQVVVAAKDLPEGTALEASHLKMAQVPEKFVQPYAVRSPGEILHRVTAAPIAEGEQILSNKVRASDATLTPKESTLSGVMQKGKRAVTIAVDTITGVGGFVRPGDSVDILWTVQVPGAGAGSSKQEGEVVTMTLFQDVPVYAVGREAVGRAGSKPKGGSEEPAQYTVTLALSPQETSFLLFARDQGRIQLSLRPRADSGTQVAVTPANAATFNSFMEGQLGGTPNPSTTAPPKKTARPVEVYKGLKRDAGLVPGEE